MTFQEYVVDINKRYKTGNAREHTYRGSLQNLLEYVIPNIMVSNEAARISCGAPDFILSRDDIGVLYIEAKDIGNNLDETENSEQLKRYRESLDNLILTDYMEFRFYKDNEKVDTIKLCELRGDSIKPLSENFSRLNDLLINFTDKCQTVKSAKQLAKMMARKARLMKDIFLAVLEDSEDNSLKEQFRAFKKVLVADMKEAQFADVYAQTITYGLFTARLHDKSLDDFSRMESLELIPKNNPFLRKLFYYIAGSELDDRVTWIVDALCELYRATDLREILKDFGAVMEKNDPILHFYETFLFEYDPKLRKKRGVFYTPEPVVNFIVRAVDDILKSHFGLRKGLTDISKVSIEIEDKEKGKEKRNFHKVQILDMAAGTGTFLTEVMKQIYKSFKGQEGLWSSYVENDLLPRLHGFELLIASYAVCHMKLDMLLKETGYSPSNSNNPPRVSVFLTNSLEEYHPKLETMFANWLSKEANEASKIKKETPIMVVLGNPPYSGISSNMGKWINDLIENYKYVDGEHFGERKHWLHDDYVKFIRCSQYHIDRAGEGVLAYINNHSFLDNPTFRGMRWSLLQTFDEIYIIDLHGNSKKKETAPDGSKDKNVFDIQQGVSINLFIKTGKKKEGELGKVFHYDLYGSRESKYQFLWDKEKSMNSIDFAELKPQSPYYFFVPKDLANKDEYDKGFSVKDLFMENSVGIVTGRDSFAIHHTARELKTSIAQFRAMDDETARVEFSLGTDTQNWKINLARKDLEESVFGNGNDKPVPISYRPFDIRYTYYTGNSKGFHCRPIKKVMQHFITDENVGLITNREQKVNDFDSLLVSTNIIDSHIVDNISYFFPLYLYTNPPQH